MRMRVRVPDTARMFVRVSVRYEPRPVAFFDAPKLPQSHGQTPGQQKHTQDQVPQDTEIQSLHPFCNGTMQIEQTDAHLEQLNRADQQRHGDRQAGGRDIVEDLSLIHI